MFSSRCLFCLLFFVSLVSIGLFGSSSADFAVDTAPETINLRKQFVSPNFSEQHPVEVDDIMQISWGAGKGQAPQLWFWENVDEYKQIQEKVQTIAQKKEKQGVIPRMGLQLWKTTWKRSLPPGEDSQKQGHIAWIDWVKKRPELLGRDKNGRLFDNDSWGYISPLVPLQKKDFPPDFEGKQAYFMDWQADKLGRFAAFTGARGIQFTDFFDSHPHTGVFDFFNERIMEDFAENKHIPLRGTFKQKTRAIRNKYHREWLDYFVEQWAQNWATLAQSIEKHSGKEPLLSTQVSHQPAVSRRYGAVDPRVILEKMSPDNILFAIQTLQPFSMNKRYVPASYESTVLGMHAAREPEAYYAHILSASEKNYWDAVKKIWPNLSPSVREELGWKRLKRIWIESAWVHVANRDGSVRRAVGAYMPFYHSLGDINQEWVQMITDISPARPFGLAYYYSVNIEKEIERRSTGKLSRFEGAYLYSETFDDVTKYRENGVPINYYVSNVALLSLFPKNYPTAWIVPQRYGKGGKDLLPIEERKALKKIAPIYSEKNINLLPKQQIVFNNDSQRSLAGFAFYDNQNRLIVVVSDTISENAEETEPSSFPVKIDMQLPQGEYQVVDYLANTANTVTSNGQMQINVDLERWDTKVLIIDISSSN